MIVGGDIWRDIMKPYRWYEYRPGAAKYPIGLENRSTIKPTTPPQDDLGTRWYVRYAIVGCFLWFAFWISTNESMARLWWLALMAVLVAACLAWEILLLLLAGGLLYVFFGAVAALPVSVAIIIGALMIADSKSK
jgi:hypothetical protein